MAPALKEGDVVVVNTMSYLFSSPQVGHIAVFKHPQKEGMLLIKRVKKEEHNRYWLQGDNTSESSDSRQFGWIKKGLIEGKVIHKTALLDMV